VSAHIEVLRKMHNQGRKAVHEKISNRRTSDYAGVAKSFTTLD